MRPLARTWTWLGAAVAGLVMAPVLIAWSGVYNVAASRGHWAIMEWFLEFGMKNSVKRRAWGLQAPPLDRADLYVLGAAHFHRACAHCHGAPGIPGELTARRALPPPPDLAHVSSEWKDREIFWIVKHGIKYTGMPAWMAQDRDDEVWAMVAFLKRMPQLDEGSYRRLALGSAEIPTQGGRDIASFGLSADAVGACARCHGAEHRGPASGLVPILHGQSPEFLTAALQAYANGTRPSGIMQPIAAELRADAIGKLAEYYAGLALPRPTSRPDASAGGRSLATNGDPDAKIPACDTCHNTRALPIYPRLAGQNAPYMENRLRLWKSGLPQTTAGELIMAPIARLLSDDQIADVSAYFSGLPPELATRPAQ